MTDSVVLFCRPKTPPPKPDFAAARKGGNGSGVQAKAETRTNDTPSRPASQPAAKTSEATGPASDRPEKPGVASPPQKPKAWWDLPGIRQEARWDAD